MLGDHGIYLKGPNFYEGAVHVPLIIACPDTVLSGKKTSALVELTDLAPTILDAVGIDIYEGMQGKSLWSLLIGDSPLDKHRDSVYCEFYNAKAMHKNPSINSTMIYDGRYKIVKVHSTGEGELYDLENNPTETYNLWDDEKSMKVKLKMLELMTDRMAWTVDPLPERKARY